MRSPVGNVSKLRAAQDKSKKRRIERRDEVAISKKKQAVAKAKAKPTIAASKHPAWESVKAYNANRALIRNFEGTFSPQELEHNIVNGLNCKQAIQQAYEQLDPNVKRFPTDVLNRIKATYLLNVDRQSVYEELVVADKVIFNI